MDQLQLNRNQCNLLYDALKQYEDYVNQPNEMAIDNTEKRKEVKNLLEYIEKNTSLGTKKFKLVDGKWVPLKN